MYRVEFSRYDKYAPNARHRLDDGGSLVQSDSLRALPSMKGSPWVGPIGQAYDPTLGL